MTTNGVETPQKKLLLEGFNYLAVTLTNYVYVYMFRDERIKMRKCESCSTLENLPSCVFSNILQTIKRLRLQNPQHYGDCIVYRLELEKGEGREEESNCCGAIRKV